MPSSLLDRSSRPNSNPKEFQFQLSEFESERECDASILFFRRKIKKIRGDLLDEFADGDKSDKKRRERGRRLKNIINYPCNDTEESRSLES